MITVVEGLLADIDGVRHGQVLVENGIIAAVGPDLGRPDHVFGDDCLIFAGMGDIHIHAREDVSGRDMLQGNVRHRGRGRAARRRGPRRRHAEQSRRPDRRRQLRRPRRNASQQANLPVTFTLYAGIGPGTRPLTRRVPYKAYMGPSVGDLYFRSLEDLDRTLATTAARPSASTARIRSCWSSTAARRRTRRAGRRSAS